MDQDDFAHEALLSADREAIFERIEQMNELVLILHGTTALDYTSHISLDDWEQIGCGIRRGYITHNSLTVDDANREVLGSVNQELHHRPNLSKSETRAERSQRQARESLLWLKGMQTLPSNCNLDLGSHFAS
jgi:hypothetical protein